ncbi:AMIN-like domain-containing (lipo)protein [Streptomyces violascens]|uniref:AMIN-like domain-containing (lipo)protein n=1 Tax=Streptomyces violascens TaxID=67381 RepID=UPI0036558B2B
MATLVLAGPAPAQAATAATPASACQGICVVDARTGAHPDFDRLVFDLHGTGLPRVESTTNTTGDYAAGGSGEERRLQIPGKSYLLLDISGEAHALSSGLDAYSTPAVQPVSLPSLKGVQLTSSGYEGHVTFGLSLGDYSRYQVSTLTGPNRVVVDIYH